MQNLRIIYRGNGKDTGKRTTLKPAKNRSKVTQQIPPNLFSAQKSKPFSLAALGTTNSKHKHASNTAAVPRQNKQSAIPGTATFVELEFNTKS